MENEAMEIMENVADAIVEENTVTEPACSEATGANVVTTLVKATVIGGMLLGAYLLVKRDEVKEKMTKRRIKKLEKAGYVVSKYDDIETDDETIEEIVEE